MKPEIWDRGYADYILGKTNPFNKKSTNGKSWQAGADAARTAYPEGSAELKRAQLEVLSSLTR